MTVSAKFPARATSLKWFAAWSVWAALQSALLAQGVPAPGTPGPMNPTPPQTSNVQSHPSATIVINPTVDECNAGWSPSLRWTAEQFDLFCGQLRSSK